MIVDALIILLCFLFAGIINAGETAIISAAKSKLEELSSEGKRRAILALQLKESMDNLTATVQISTTILIVLAAAVTSEITVILLQPYLLEVQNAFVHGMSFWIAILIGVLCTTIGAIVFSSLIPKSLGQKYAITVSLKFAPTLTFLSRIFILPQHILTRTANIFLKPFKDSTTFSEPQLSEEAIMTIIEKGTESGVIDQTEHDLIESIFQFTGTTAKEIMIPRTDIVAINGALPPDEILRLVVEEGYTRMPVYSGSIDNIIGIVYAKDVVSLIEHRDLIILHDIMRPVFFIPEREILEYE